MATKKPASKDAKPVAAKVGQPFTYTESKTAVQVTAVHKDAGTVDIQEPDGACRYWGDVPANTDWLKPVESEEPPK